MHCLCIDLILQHYIFFFFNDTATTEIYTLSLHDALPIFTSTQSGLSCLRVARFRPPNKILAVSPEVSTVRMLAMVWGRSEEHTSELQSRQYLVCRLLLEKKKQNNLSNIKSNRYTISYYEQ